MLCLDFMKKKVKVILISGWFVRKFFNVRNDLTDYGNQYSLIMN